MGIYTDIKKNTYQDSMKMMQFQATLNSIPGVVVCGVAMATPQNKAQFEEAGLLTEQVQQAGSNDLLIVARVESTEVIPLVVAEIDKYFSRIGIIEEYPGKMEILPKSISSALKRSPNANLAMISVPGEYAALEATKALNSGLNVFLFSDNVPLEDEVELKALAEQKGLLLMGPDCGTAIISGIPLGFSNAVRRGRIGIVGASGSGMQEVCCLIHRMGEGISQAIGTGGRDLSARVGGKTFIRAMDALFKDEGTDVVVLMAKHCHEEVARRILEKARTREKPIVVYFPASDSLINGSIRHVYKAENLEHVAASSVAILCGKFPPKPITKDVIAREMKEVLRSESSKFLPMQKYVRALFTGGSFVYEASVILSNFFDRVYIYPPHDKMLGLNHPLKSKEHSILDLGDDYFTRGKLHPMIDPMARIERISKETRDRRVKVILLDVVLGYGAHSDPGGALKEIILFAKERFRQQGGYLSFVVSLCGTEEDPQHYTEQEIKLKSCGAVVTDSSTKAAFLAGLIASQ